jgi:hypothetical protein
VCGIRWRRYGLTVDRASPVHGGIVDIVPCERLLLCGVTKAKAINVKSFQCAKLL